MKLLALIALAAVVTCVVGYSLPSYQSLDFFAFLLVFIAAIYVGTALAGSGPLTIAIQTLVALAFVFIAILGLWYSPIWLVAGYFLHGVWDMLHHWVRHDMRLPRWYPPACLVYDWLVGGFVLYMWH
jgi:hypothetical protein